MFTQLEGVELRFEEINHQLQDPQIVSNQSRYRDLMKELSELEPVVNKFREFKKISTQILGNKQIIDKESDADLVLLAKEELSELNNRTAKIQEELRILLLPKNPNDEKNTLVEIRAGAGGDEASLFAYELFRAYSLFSSKMGWKVEVMSTSPGNVGGYKEVIALITGEKVFSRLKYESGVHRVQRVPETETQGRVHTSTITVAVLPESDEVNIQINPNDLRIDVYRSSGHGGQSVNTTDSAVRITHLPSGLVVTCQDEKSQLKNKNKAMKVLQVRLQAIEDEKALKSASDARLAQIGTGDRSERIRTYNFPQSRITDHRIGFTTHQITSIMSGDFAQIIDPLIAHYQAEQLKGKS